MCMAITYNNTGPLCYTQKHCRFHRLGWALVHNLNIHNSTLKEAHWSTMMPNMARPRCHGRPTSRASELLQFSLSFTEPSSNGENNQGARNVAGSVA